MINKHGIKMIGLRRAAGATKGMSGYYSGHYIQLSYDRSDGEVLADYHYSFGQNSWTQYHSKDVIRVANISTPKTMQQIADMIYDAVATCKSILE